MQTVYLDTCCLNRPFDDQAQDRVRLEAEAVLLILGHAERGEWQWVSSDLVAFELRQAPDPERRRRTSALVRYASRVMQVTQTMEDRGQELTRMGFGSYDALHLAIAEEARVDIFLTTDDRLLRVAQRLAQRLLVRVENPLTWLQKAENR